MLIVEDSEFSQKCTQAQLDSLGVQWVAAMDGQEAVKQVESYLLQSKFFDIILMDLIMPIKNGYEASKEIRMLE